MTNKSNLRDLAAEKGLVQVMATHSPLSARLAEEAGFDGLWASGFELSALYGLPDVSLITMTQHLEMLRAIAGQASLPVVADIDTGFGNAVNVAHAVKAYERAGTTCVVIEDKHRRLERRRAAGAGADRLSGDDGGADAGERQGGHGDLGQPHGPCRGDRDPGGLPAQAAARMCSVHAPM
ncbi:MAG: isocitrate lyase/PEP mutase family protein [Kiloniellales bacterium]|nr:isocitrate lyase/PEP mutase family protein [Kiloniellales bacterium]